MERSGIDGSIARQCMSIRDRIAESGLINWTHDDDFLPLEDSRDPRFWGQIVTRDSCISTDGFRLLLLRCPLHESQSCPLLLTISRHLSGLSRVLFPFVGYKINIFKIPIHVSCLGFFKQFFGMAKSDGQFECSSSKNLPVWEWPYGGSGKGQTRDQKADGLWAKVDSFFDPENPFASSPVETAASHHHARVVLERQAVTGVRHGQAA